MWSLRFGLQIVRSPNYKEPVRKRKVYECIVGHTSARTGGLAGPGLHERLLDICGEKLAPATRGAALRLAFAVRDRPAGFAPEVLLAALRSNDRWRLGEELPDLAELVRDAERIDPRPGLIRLHEAVHERVEPRERFCHVPLLRIDASASAFTTLGLRRGHLRALGTTRS